jgi:hypothetical protein
MNTSTPDKALLRYLFCRERTVNQELSPIKPSLEKLRDWKT